MAHIDVETIVCKDKLLYDGELPYVNSRTGYRSYPFIKQVSIKQIASFWGLSVVERCIPIQRAYNAIKKLDKINDEQIERYYKSCFSILQVFLFRYTNN